MSSPSNPHKPNLEFLRKDAKALLKRCRAGDAAAIARIRAHLPRLAALDNESVALQTKLADLHHALARERGYESWAALKREDSVIEAFLVAVRGGSLKDMQRTLAALPEMAEESMHAASAIGDADAVARHLQFDSNSLTAEHRRWPPLFYACASPLNRLTARHSAGILEVARLLLDRGADPDTSVLTDPSDPESKLPAVRRAMMGGNMPVLMLLRQRGATLDFTAWRERFKAQRPQLIQGYQEFFRTPEARESFRKRLDEMREMGKDPMWGEDKWWFHMRPEIPPQAPLMFKALLEKGGLDPNEETPNGRSMFHNAAENGTAEMVELFLAHGADVNRKTADGRTALVLATRAGNNLIADALRAHGATDQGLRPLDQFVGACLRVDSNEARTILGAHPNVLQLMTSEDAELLVRAAGRNILLQARLMLECGFDPGASGESGITPLHAAAWHGHLEMVELLLKFHAPVNVRDTTYGTSPLAWAAHGSRHTPNADDRYRAIVSALLEAGGSSEHAVSGSGTHPEDLASEAVAELLREWRL